MRRESIFVRFGGTQEREAFNRMLAERPDLMDWLKVGGNDADKFAVPQILKGILGSTEAEINRRIDGFVESGLVGLRGGGPGEEADEDECHFWRLGFTGVAFEARDIRIGRGRPVANC